MRSAVVLDDLGAASLATSRYEDGSSCSWHFAPFPCGQVQPIFISTNDDPKEKAWGMKWDELNNCLFDHVAFQKQTSPAIVTHMAHDLLCLDKIIHQHGDMALRYCAGGKGGAYISFPKPLNGAFSAHILLPTTGISGQICHPRWVFFFFPSLGVLQQCSPTTKESEVRLSFRLVEHVEQRATETCLLTSLPRGAV